MKLHTELRNETEVIALYLFIYFCCIYILFLFHLSLGCYCLSIASSNDRAVMSAKQTILLINQYDRKCSG